MISRRASPDMRTLEQIYDDIKRLSKDDQEALLDWLTNLLEDQLELTDEFKAKIEQGKADIAAGRVRIIRPNSVN
jgi:mRNA-degrading endonuclease RelE of RelBE toxin-antitoxin system